MSKYVKICQNMSKYVKICQNMSKYVKICQNMSKYYIEKTNFKFFEYDLPIFLVNL